MLNNSNKNILYNLCFGLSKLYTNIQQDQKAKLDYHMSTLFAYMAGGVVVVVVVVVCVCVCVCGGGGGGLEVLKCFVRGGQKLF